MSWIIDRFEGDFAVLENVDSQNILEVRRSELPRGVKEGQVIRIVDGRYFIDLQGTAKRRERIKEKFERLKFKK